MDSTYDMRRAAMVRSQLKRRNISAPAVLAAMARVPRHKFVPERYADLAYIDNALPIEAGQTISQPYIVALMTQALTPGPGDRVLEVGTGSGYAAAVLAEIVAEVYTVERHQELAELAGARLRAQGYTNAHVRCGDGTLGWPERAPFDGIIVAAGGPGVPNSLRDQLAIGGRLVMPVGHTRHGQRLVRIVKRGEDDYKEENLGEVRFVPLIGEEGWT